MSCSRNLFQAVETNCREVEDNPNEKRTLLDALFAFGVFLAAR